MQVNVDRKIWVAFSVAEATSILKKYVENNPDLIGLFSDFNEDSWDWSSYSGTDYTIELYPDQVKTQIKEDDLKEFLTEWAIAHAEDIGLKNTKELFEVDLRTGTAVSDALGFVVTDYGDGWRDVDLPGTEKVD
jgi:hypothetical protein